MPVRIYDISKKLGLENKEVLSKAKELGIAAARVASSSLDKITAEYLEEHIRKDHPELAVAETAPPPPPAPIHEPIVVVSAPPPEVKAPVVLQEKTATATIEIEAPAALSLPADEVNGTVETAAPPAPAAPPKITLPAGPKVGEKVGFI